MSPDWTGPLALLFVFAFIFVIAAIYAYGERWFLEMDARDRDNE